MSLYLEKKMPRFNTLIDSEEYIYKATVSSEHIRISKLHQKKTIDNGMYIFSQKLITSRA